MQTVLSVNGLSKNYGNVVALSGLDFTVHKGDVFGILGPNGSGKTSTLGIVLGLVKPTAGSFSWFEQGNHHSLRKKVGVMLDRPGFYPHLNSYQNLQLVADIKEIGSTDITEKMETTGVAEFASRKFVTYSTGMKQRLALTSALLGDPEVLVLDEPTNGLDPEGIADVRNIIISTASKGTTVILASHLLDEVQKVCSHVAVINKGKKAYEGQVQALIAGDEGIEIGSDDQSKLEKVLLDYSGIDQANDRKDHFFVRLKPGYKSSELSAHLIKNGVNITHFAQKSGSLEEEFLQLLSGKNG